MTGRAWYQLFHADAFEWLPQRKATSVHAVVTDPPFGIIEYSSDQLSKRRNGNGGIWRLPQSYDGQNRSPMPRFTVLQPKDRERIKEFHSKLAPLLMRVLVPGGHVIIASQNLFLHFVMCAFVDAGFEVRGQVARIIKTLRGGDRPKGAHKEYPEVSVTPRTCWEPWLVFRKPCQGRVSDNLKKWWTGALRRPEEAIPFSDLIESNPARGIERKIAPHPSLKPQAFMRQMARASLPLGKGVVLDPFMGSGATVAAATAVGLNSIGIEKDKEYFRLADIAVPKLAQLELTTATTTG